MRYLHSVKTGAVGAAHVPVRVSQAFTLIELLVVVAIIAVLMSVLLPAMGGAHQQARTLRCSSNLRQIALAGILYATDNQDVLCHIQGWEANKIATLNIRCLGDYLTTPQYKGRSNIVTNCPTTELLYPSVDSVHRRNYLINRNAGSNLDPAGLDIRRITSIKAPHGMLFFSDAPTTGTISAGGVWNFGYVQNWSGGAVGASKMFYLHNNYMNIAYVDGHVALGSRKLISDGFIDPTSTLVQGHD